MIVHEPTLESASPLSANVDRSSAVVPRLWGQTIFGLEEAYWKSFGVQLVSLGSATPIDPRADFYLLHDGRLLTLTDVKALLDRFRKQRCPMVAVRMQDMAHEGYREFCVTDEDGRFVRYERVYGSRLFRPYRVALTSSVSLACAWQHQHDIADAWREIRRRVVVSKRGSLRQEASLYDWTNEQEVSRFAVELASRWENPRTALPNIKEIQPGVWVEANHDVKGPIKATGRIWLGHDRRVEVGEHVVGPAVLWDRRSNSGSRRSSSNTMKPYAIRRQRLSEMSRMRMLAQQPQDASRRLYLASKRVFDIVFAVCALAFTLPFYPLIMLAIYLEDGMPFFFGHRRETQGGKLFACLKFRSMCKDAEEIRKRIARQNHCDGPQFYIQRDPRMTRVGAIIRDLQIDEWPQFWHVLTGKMSVVGPRPLPRAENQYSPAWREMRLSVRPGITGLWQLKRSRKDGLDFQEWIKYDAEYVANASFTYDLWILWESIMMMVRLGLKVVWSILPKRDKSSGGSAETTSASMMPEVQT